jgi:ribosomal protein S6
MQKYELTIVVDAKLTPSKRKAVQETIEKTVALLKGKVGTVVDWGEKELASKIKGREKGYLVHLPLELTPDSAKKLTEKIKTEDAIIRYLMVRI